MTLVSWPRPTPAAWIALLVAALFRLGYAALPYDGLLFESEERARAYLVSEMQYRVAGPASPEVLVLGTSRLLDLTPRALGVSGHEVAVLAQPGNGFWDARVLLERNPEMLDRCALLVMDVVPTMLRLSPSLAERKFLHLASLEDRLAVAPFEARARAVADLVYPLWSAAQPPESWRRGLLALLARPEARLASVSADWRRGVAFLRAQSAARRRREPGSINPYTLEFVAPQQHPEAWAPAQVRALQAIRALRPEGCRLVVVALPPSPELMAAIGADADRTRSWEAWRHVIDDQAAPDVDVIWQTDPGPIGLEPDHYSDDLHFTDEGLVPVGRWLGERIRDELATP